MLLQIARFWAGLARLRRRPAAATASAGWSAPTSTTTAIPDAAEPGHGRQRLHQRHGRLGADAAPWSSAARCPSRAGGELSERIRPGPRTSSSAGRTSPARLHVPFHRRASSASSTGYGDLAELDWDGYRQPLRRHPPAGPDPGGRGRHRQPLPGLQAGRRADARLPLLARRARRGCSARLGLPPRRRTPGARTVDYYLHRTSHGSTLSGLVHAWVLARVRPRRGLDVLPGGADRATSPTSRAAPPAEGIHLGAMAGTLDLVQRGLTGLETRDQARCGSTRRRCPSCRSSGSASATGATGTSICASGASRYGSRYRPTRTPRCG